jgi:Spy/CpxP family protein refolding chaperone
MRIQQQMVGAWMLGLALTVGVFGTATAQVRSEVELTRQQIQTERQELVTVGMELTDEQAATFWPVYREYRNELAPVSDRLVDLILGYAEQFDSVTDEYAEQMLEDYLDIQSDKLNVQKKYVNRFKRVLPSKLVARFYQIENKLDAVVALDLAMSVPVLQ